MNGTVFGYKKADNYSYEDGKQDTVAYELPAFLRASCVPLIYLLRTEFLLSERYDKLCEFVHIH